MENWLVILFLSHLPGPLSFYTALENYTICLQQFLRFRGGGELPLPHAGAPAIIKFSRLICFTYIGRFAFYLLNGDRFIDNEILKAKPRIDFHSEMQCFG